jgi:hypothetical protein
MKVVSDSPARFADRGRGSGSRERGRVRKEGAREAGRGNRRGGEVEKAHFTNF